MGICKFELYKDNVVVTHRPSVCYGTFGQPPCKDLGECKKRVGDVKRVGDILKVCRVRRNGYL